MAFSEICRICFSGNVRMFVLKKTGLQNLYKTLTNRFRDDDPIIVCFICHARLIRCRRLQQQAIESNAVLEQLLAEGSMSVPKPHQTGDEIQFTPIHLVDIRPVECYIENDCKDNVFSLHSIKIEYENFENEISKFEENGIPETEQHIIPANNFSKPPERKIKSKSTYSNINDVYKGNLDLESNTIKSNAKVKEDNQPINKKGKDPAKIMKKKILKQKSVNTLTQKYSFECDDCNKKFSTKDILAKHISYGHMTQNNSDTTAVRTHVEQTSVPQLPEVLNCYYCKFKTSHKRYICAHLKAHSAKQVYCCNNCDYKCTNRINLQYHMKVHTGEKPFSCNICEYKCIRRSYLRKHMKIHSGEKPFSCNICEYRCIKKSDLQTHIKRHTGEKPFSCNICEFKCIRKSQLNNHLKMHTGEKPFSCNICEYKCIQKNDLRRHIKLHTGEKPFSCNICEYRCIKKSDLQRHMKIHTGEKPFSCNICKYKCIKNNDLRKHIKLHTGEKPFSCNICEYRCKRKDYLQNHLKKHAGAESFS